MNSINRAIGSGTFSAAQDAGGVPIGPHSDGGQSR